MSNPAVGSGASHGKLVAEGSAEASRVRSKWIRSLLKGEVEFAIMAEASRSTGPDRHLETLKLYTILSKRPGWSVATATEALERNGFSNKTMVRSIRRNTDKVAVFTSILKTGADRWRSRPEPPKGWPWNGKLSLLVASAGDVLPDEFASLFGEDDDDDLQNEPSEELMAFLSIDDEDEDGD